MKKKNLRKKHRHCVNIHGGYNYNDIATFES